jgi:hypothetical protein
MLTQTNQLLDVWKINVESRSSNGSNPQPFGYKFMLQATELPVLSDCQLKLLDVTHYKFVCVMPVAIQYVLALKRGCL